MSNTENVSQFPRSGQRDQTFTEEQLRSMTASVNIINWRQREIGQIQWSTNSTLAMLAVFRAVSLVVPDKIVEREAEQMSSDIAEQPVDPILEEISAAMTRTGTGDRV